jgi:preprotein translocase subunit SecG
MWVTYLVTTIHVIVCIFLIAVVLLQSGKSADIAAAFGGMGSQTAFGTRTAATVLSKATTWAAIIFMLTSITLTIFASQRRASSGSVLEGTKSAPTKTAPPPAQKPAPEPQPSTPSR